MIKRINKLKWNKVSSFSDTFKISHYLRLDQQYEYDSYLSGLHITDKGSQSSTHAATISNWSQAIQKSMYLFAYLVISDFRNRDSAYLPNWWTFHKNTNGYTHPFKNGSIGRFNCMPTTVIELSNKIYFVGSRYCFLLLFFK